MSDQFLGEIRMFAGSFAPQNWALCNGQLLAIQQYAALFSLIGTYYGGNGTSNFGLPNMQGRAPIHQGQALGGSPYTIGEMGGTESVTLAITQIPVHTHAVQAQTAATTAAPNGAIWSTSPNNVFASGAANTTMLPTSVGVTGNSLPHNNLPNFQVVTFIIALAGIFPSRS